MERLIDEYLEFEDNKLYHYYPLPQYGGIYKKDLVMTKEIFIACYEKWIKGVEDGEEKIQV